jgi:aspartyl-tRNA(Asn)/glutamyl-tRNA(Gln) amidotransferase subunit B
MEYEAVIGLETHVQLKTKSKVWCGCANAFGVEPNTNVCLGLPGLLPVPNEEALRLTALTGYLLDCEIPAMPFCGEKPFNGPDRGFTYSYRFGVAV